jgi:hypothetical protein
MVGPKRLRHRGGEHIVLVIGQFSLLVGSIYFIERPWNIWLWVTLGGGSQLKIIAWAWHVPAWPGSFAKILSNFL